jgi:hypothetical protein
MGHLNLLKLSVAKNLSNYVSSQALTVSLMVDLPPRERAGILLSI